MANSSPTSSSSSIMEFAVQMSTEADEMQIRGVLEGLSGVHEVQVDVGQEVVLITSSLSSFVIKEKLESTGKLVILRGITNTSSSSAYSIAAVAVMKASGCVKGVIRLVQGEGACHVEGSMDSIAPGPHTVSIHTAGDITNGALSCGDLWSNRTGTTGRLDTVTVLEDGTVKFQFTAENIDLADIIGRSLVVSPCIDTASNTTTSNTTTSNTTTSNTTTSTNTTSNTTTSTNTSSICGVIARSSGISGNTKKVCQCSGKTIWEEAISNKLVSSL